MNFTRRKCFAILLVVISITYLQTGCSKKYDDLDLSVYQYRDTQNLVKFVYDASMILEQEGKNGLEHFKNNREKYREGEDFYLYIYKMDGTNLFHAGMKELEGKNLEDITDKNGKKITVLVNQALNSKNNPHAWVHYSWWEPGKFYPVPKSSCHFKVKTPEGEELFVGGGMNYPHEEREFIRIIVDDAADLIKRKGTAAYQEIANPVSQYNYRDVRVFVFNKKGSFFVSPVLGDNLAELDLLNCQDQTGHKPFAKGLKDLEDKDMTWQIFMEKNRYKRELIKKCLYIRKVRLNNEKVFVAAITSLPEPP